MRGEQASKAVKQSHHSGAARGNGIMTSIMTIRMIPVIFDGISNGSLGPSPSNLKKAVPWLV